jgi:hypothetical protein
MGMYEPIKKLIGGKGGSNDGALIKYAASYLSGGIGSALFNPIDLIKVRF